MSLNKTMIELIQALWDQMRTDLRSDALPQMDQATHALLRGSLGPLTDLQVEDLESVDQSLAKLNKHVEGEPIDWTDYSEAAHALRGPLNSTIGFSRLITKGVDGPINEAQRAALERIHTVSRRLLALFNLLLDALLLTGDGIDLTIEPVRAGDILEELVVTGRVLADSRGHLFEADVMPEVADVAVRCDAKRLKQALSALLAVSAKYMNDGVMTLRTGLGNNELVIQLQSQECRLPEPLLANLACLLTDEADRSFPYDAHLRLGLAWHLLTAMEGNLVAKHVDTTCAFIITFPLG